MEKKNPCIVMVPSPGLSHLIALVEFSKRLLSFQRENLHVKFIVPTLGAPSSSMKSILNNSLPPNSSFIILPQINIEDLTEKSDPATQMKETVKHSLPFIPQELTSLSFTNHLVAILFSVFSTDVIDLASEFNLLTYLFFASGATLFSFCFHFPQLDQEADDSSKNSLLELIDPVHVLGCSVPFQVNDLPNPVLFERSSEVYKSFLAVVKNYSLVDGVINNTFTDLEPDAVKAWCGICNPLTYWQVHRVVPSNTLRE
ncbi:Hydroquinone glucosyltransferase [Arachis hypogaea]|nr:Hydroquinone glucosyltransferase [Arachis hypogaea]